MEKLKLKVEELTVDTFDVDEGADDALLHGAVKTLDPTRCEPHSCMPTFPC